MPTGLAAGDDPARRGRRPATPVSTGSKRRRQRRRSAQHRLDERRSGRRSRRRGDGRSSDRRRRRRSRPRRASAVRRRGAERGGDLEQADVALLVTAVVADGGRPARAARWAASPRRSPTAGWPAGSSGVPPANGAAAALLDEREGDRLGEPGGEHARGGRAASRAMRGSDGGGGCMHRREGGRQVLEAVMPADLLDEIFGPGDVGPPAGHGDVPRRCRRRRRRRSRAPSGCVPPPRAAPACRAAPRRGAWVSASASRHVRPRMRVDQRAGGAAGADDLQQRAGPRHRRAPARSGSAPRSKRIDASVRRPRRLAVAAHRLRLEPRALEHDPRRSRRAPRSRRRPSRRRSAVARSASAMTSMSAARVRALPSSVVERLAGAGPAHDDRGVGKPRVIERVHRLPELEQHVVGDVDDVADWPHALGGEPALQPGRRGADAHLGGGADVARAEIRRVHPHREACRAPTAASVAERRCPRPTGDGRRSGSP